MRPRNLLYILSNGRVAAIDKKDGVIIWDIKLKDHVGSSMAHAVGQINVEGEHLFIGVSGILLCLSTKDGSLKWKNELKGWGYSFISMANAGHDASAAASIAAAAASTAVTAAATV
ncbi:MAG: hypothetical protein EOO06_02275 [Chitinophagaceae bacterium]|nr:MAG: hypothetical protein EOO06_02275 [Chitinophagaceae bacterium]